MKRYLTLLFSVLLCLSLFTACAPESVHYETADYLLEMPYRDDFRILRLSDTHIASKDNRKEHYDFLTLTINDAEPDLIVVTGDVFTFADKATAIDFFTFLDSFNTPWTVVFGNHDEQCYFSIDWLTETLNTFSSHCLFIDHQDDDVYGNCNFAINLTEGGKTIEQLVFLDSNRYNFETFSGYDYIREDEVELYERIVKETTEKEGAVVPSLLFFHIPTVDFKDAMDALEQGDSSVTLEEGTIGEGVSCPKKDAGLFDKVLSLNSTDGIFVGHDHYNNCRLKYKGVYLSYGMKSTDRIYSDEDLLGGQIIIIHRDHSLDFETIYHTYSEVHDHD